MDDTVKYRTETGDHDQKGRFVKGNRASKGRSAGAVNRALKLAREAAETVALPQLIAMAKDGDRKACEALVAYGLPRLKPVEAPEPLAVPELTDRRNFLIGLLDTVRNGQLTIEQAARLMTLVDGVGAQVNLAPLPPLTIQFLDSTGAEVAGESQSQSQGAT